MMEKNHLVNGFLVTAPPDKSLYPKYHGVDNNVWPVEINKKQYPILSTIADNEFTDMEIPLLVGYDAFVVYNQICKSKGIPVRGLYCEVFSSTVGQYLHELHRQFAKQESFLGFDFAYPNGDYYSAVLNDLLYRNVRFLNDYTAQLNQYGLFSTLDAVKSFASDRELLKSALDVKKINLLLESGEFVIYKLYSFRD